MDWFASTFPAITRGRLLPVLVVLLAALFLGGTAAQAESYRGKTSTALSALKQSVALLREGKIDESRNALSPIGNTIGELTVIGRVLQENAVRNEKLCAGRVVDLDLRIGAMDSRMRDYKADVQGAEEGVTRKKELLNLLEDEIRKLAKRMADLEQKLREGRERFEELRNWFWVPVYGQYLAVRQAIDELSGEYRSVRNSYNDESVRLERAQAQLTQEQMKLSALLSQKQALEAQKNRLEEEREQMRQQSLRIRHATVFYAESINFWQKIESLAGISVSGYKENLTTLYDLLGLENDQSYLRDMREQMLMASHTLEGALLELADKLDKGDDFVGRDAAAICMN